MADRKYFELDRNNGAKFYIRPDKLVEKANDLEEFLSEEENINTLEFAKKVMFSHEIKANNKVEGYGDDIKLIKETIKNNTGSIDSERSRRIINLNRAYNYILNNKNIDKESLRTLYSIISDGLLEEYDIKNMGEYYRNKPVYILNNGRLDEELDEGLPVDKIDEFMDKYFNFLNTSIKGFESENYIKSQILHFYFVYIHPYFDVNGRTSRTLAMWYLLNNQAYKYIIFNRGISFKGSVYDKTIIKSKTRGDMTYFIELMLDTVRVELEKEYYMQVAADSINSKLSATDYQTLLYFLSMKGSKTILDFASMYNRNNEHKSIKDINETMIEPLLDKGILDVKGTTKKEVQGVKNKVLVLKPIDIDKGKISNLNI